MNWLDVPAHFDIFDRIEGVVSTFRYADWESAYRNKGFIGLVEEFSACITSSNAPTITVLRDAGWRGIDVERLLYRHGVRIWDRGISSNDLYFCVKRRQVKWAEYLLLRAGVPVTSVLNEPRNVAWTDKYEPGSEPPTRGRAGFNLIDLLRSLLG